MVKSSNHNFTKNELMTQPDDKRQSFPWYVSIKKNVQKIKS